MLLPAGITINQYSLLINLFRAAVCSTTTLAMIMKLERTTLIRNLKPLIEADLIRDLSEEGKRNRQLTLTEAGLATLEAAQKLWGKAQAGLKKRIGEEGFEKLMKTLIELEQLLQAKI
jgi:DNA-binding MarR family transcriptional regulator